MEDKDLTKKLNWFYSLEVTQVDNYLAQSKEVNDPYLVSGLQRVAFIEQEHVDGISNMIISLGAKPTLLGDIISPLLGTIMGKALGTTKLATMFKTNIMLEARAVSDYLKLIEKLKLDEKYQVLNKTLQFNLIDEDLHSSWFAQVIAKEEAASWPLSPVLAKEKELEKV